METKVMKILEKIEDYRNWEKLIQHCEFIEGLTDVEREKAKRAFQLLRTELGQDFLSVAFDIGHPIIQNIVNLAPWTRKWIAWFAEALKELKDQENYSSLLNRITDKDKFSEGFSVLEIAYKFSKAGFRISIDPSIDVSGRTKVPDIKTVNEGVGDELFVEVSILGESERHRDAIVKEIEEVVKKVKKETSFQELIVEDVIEIGIAPENDKQFLEKWARERGWKVGEFSGPPFDVDEVLRTKRKIENEQKQLPHSNPNILIIKNNNLFFHVRDIRKAINELEETVYKYSHLLAVVVTGEYMGSGENIISMKDQHVFIKKARADLLVEQYIILFNQFCELKISPST